MSLFLRLLAEPQPPHDLIRPNPRVRTLRSSRAVSLLLTTVFFVLFLLLMLFSLVNDIVTSGPSPFPWYFLFLPLTLLLNVGVFSLQIHYWKRVDPWRFIAALGDKRLLADEQPEPSAEALQIPVAIRMSPFVERRNAIGYGLFSLFLITLEIYLALAIFLPLSLPWFWSLLIAMLVGGLFTLGMVLIFQIRYPIEVSQEGIRFRTHDKVYAFMLWHEARLFARYSEPGPWRDSPAMLYELSSASHVVYWTWIRRKNPLNFIAGPSLPFEEHNAQMRALSELVAAKTGLPLYDLSKGETLKLEGSPRNQQSV